MRIILCEDMSLEVLWNLIPSPGTYSRSGNPPDAFEEPNGYDPGARFPVTATATVLPPGWGGYVYQVA